MRTGGWWAKVVVTALAVAGWLSGPLGGPARSEVYVEIYSGLVHGMANSEYSSFPRLETGYHVQIAIKGYYEPHVQGGLKLGTWFVREGALGFNYPGFLKHFGFFLDFSYHRLNYMRSQRDVYIADASNSFPVGTARLYFHSEGAAACLAFMFAGRLGYAKSPDFPYGRLQPYLALGPALLFTSQHPKLDFVWGLLGKVGYHPNSDSTVAPALAVETGLRYLALKNVSLDFSFKYRFARPSYHFNFRDPATGFRHSFTLRPSYHLLSGQIGVAYHF
ncbi:MAG: hypothetical protein FJ128_01250 [Deltaproteobacteria bacterium]|nr:hypothetical protein [Deltaproteobacteria bacterium]